MRNRVGQRLGGFIDAVEGAPLDLVEAGNRLRKIEQEIARLKVKKSTSPSDKSGEIRRNGQHRKRTLSKATPSKTSPALRQARRTSGQISATPTNLFNQEAKIFPCPHRRHCRENRGMWQDLLREDSKSLRLHVFLTEKPKALPSFLVRGLRRFMKEVSWGNRLLFFARRLSKFL